MKFDYVGDVDNLGVTEITNLIIAVDKDGHSAGLTKTFAAQEAPLVPIDWLPNQMNDPIEMGRYIQFLANSIVSLSSNGDMRKCLKRCASLSRILFVPDITNAIIKLVDGSSVFLHHKMSQLVRISARLKELDDGRSQAVSALIAVQYKELETELAKRGGEPDIGLLEKFGKEANQIVGELLCHVAADPSSRRAA
jgi:hypothetical protein